MQNCREGIFDLLGNVSEYVEPVLWWLMHDGIVPKVDDNSVFLEILAAVRVQSVTP